MLARRYKFNVLVVARYCSCHSNMKFTSSRHRVISQFYLRLCTLFKIPYIKGKKCLFTLRQKELYSVVFLIATESLLKIVVAAAEMYPILSEQKGHSQSIILYRCNQFTVPRFLLFMTNEWLNDNDIITAHFNKISKLNGQIRFRYRQSNSSAQFRQHSRSRGELPSI